MIVGALSDTHDNLEQTEKAKALFESRNVKAIIHCGDFITPIVYDVLRTLNLPFYGVFGNNDYKEALADQSHNQIKEEPYRFELGGRSVLICHQERFTKPSDKNRGVEIMVFGETHEPEVIKKGETLLVNPGEACGWVSGISTIAVIDFKSLEAEIVEIPG